MDDDFSALDGAAALLDSFPPHPRRVLRHELERWIRSQQAQATVGRIRLTEIPRWLTLAEDRSTDQVVLVGAVLAVAFDMEVSVPDHDAALLTGVVTWAVSDLEAPEPRSTLWFDLGMGLDEVATDDQLQTRLASV